MSTHGSNSGQNLSFQERVKQNQIKILRLQNPSGQIDLSRLADHPMPVLDRGSSNIVPVVSGLLVVGMLGFAAFIGYAVMTTDPQLSTPAIVTQDAPKTEPTPAAAISPKVATADPEPAPAPTPVTAPAPVETEPDIETYGEPTGLIPIPSARP